MIENTQYQTVLKLLTDAVSEVTGIDTDRLEPQLPMERFGLSSTVIMELTSALETRIPSLTTTMFFRHRTLDSLAQHLMESQITEIPLDQKDHEPDLSLPDSALDEFINKLKDLDEKTEKNPTIDLRWLDDWNNHKDASSDEELEIAIIGMAGEYPEAKNLDEFWENLKSGRDSIEEVPRKRWNHEHWYDPDKNNLDRTYSKWGGFIQDYDQFDARFFNISAKEAKNMDPQERRFLHAAWTAIESAGYCRKTMSGTSTGVFVGVMWALYNLYGAEQLSKGKPETTSSMFSSIANRLSWWLNLRGPSLAVDTMCSSSLTALHLACQSIKNGDCEQAIVGGVNICAHPLKYIHLSRGGFAAEDGRCRAFGKGGSGYVPGEGVGAVILKPLSKALANKDNVLAVIKATSLAHGGNTSGYTVPSAEGQEAVLHSALSRLSIEPEKIIYVEAHGTGTSLGDPIEIEGLQRVYGDRVKKLKVGSVKSNIGHLESCAALAGLHKLILQLQNRALVPSLHIGELNSFINWDKLQIEVQDHYEPISISQDELMGLSAFGAGGTNAHAIIAPAPAASPESQIDGPIPVVLSAQTPEALNALKTQLADWLEEHMAANLAQIGYTLMTGRDELEYRFVACVETNEELLSALRAPENSHQSQNKDLASWFANDHDTKLIWPYDQQRKLALPTYIFQSKPYWIAEPIGPLSLQEKATVHHDDALYSITWENQYEQKVSKVGDLPDAIVFNPAFEDLAKKLQETHFPSSKVLSSISLLDKAQDLTNILFLAGSEDAQAGFENIKWLQRLLLTNTNISCFAVCDENNLGLELEFSRLLSAEYSSFDCTSVYLDRFIPEEIFNAWNSYSTLDLSLGKSFRIRNGMIQAMEFRAISRGSTRSISSEEVHLLTGGTGGIALAFAQDLVARGARRLLLSGRRVQPKETAQRVIEEMKSLGVDIQYLSLDLVNSANLHAELAKALKGQKLGMIFHFAGSFDMLTPAFVSKETESVAEVIEPKYLGAINLIEIAEKFGAKEVIFASSLASVFPDLAIGATDYAAANAGLNRLSMSSEKVIARSLILPNWEDVGLGKSSSIMLSELGINGVSAKTGNALIHAALSTNDPVVLIVPHEEKFNISRALEVERAINFQDDTAPKISSLADELQQPNISRDLTQWLAELFYPIVEIDYQDWNAEDDFGSIGVDSIALARMARVLEAEISVPVAPHILIENNNLNKLSKAVLTFEDAVIPMQDTTNSSALSFNPVVEISSSRLAQEEHGIAIVGIGSILPGCEGVDAFWEKLVLGQSQITEVPSLRWKIEEYYDSKGSESVVSKWGGFVTGLEYFEPTQFGLPSDMAADTDPLVRLALWGTSYALADAGISPSWLSGVDAGVFVGSRVANWADRISKVRRNTVLGTAQNFISAHISHWLNINGPSQVVDTACSSSLYAIHQACNSLNLGECSVAIAGGSEVLLDVKPYQSLGQTGAMSPTGLCRTFDENADGFVPGEGACFFVLKRLEDSLKDGDRIYAVIESSSVNNDGRTMGVTTPNPEAQKKVVLSAMKKAGVRADQIGYIEAHGTGTQLGDPMETKSLAEVFKQDIEVSENQEFQTCGIGSVKSNIGHCLSAAGAASAAKTALSIYNKKLVPTLNCETPNSRFAFETSPFFPVSKLLDFPEKDGLCRAGINAFGFGGTNVHVQMSNRHLEMGYKPTRAPLELPSRDGPYAWHLQIEQEIVGNEVSKDQEKFEFQLTQCA